MAFRIKSDYNKLIKPLYHFAHLDFGTFDLHTGNLWAHAAIRSRDGSLKLEADPIWLCALKDF